MRPLSPTVESESGDPEETVECRGLNDSNRVLGLP